MLQEDVKESLLHHAITYLEMTSGFMVPARTLWKQLMDDPSAEELTYEQFIEMLQHDTRFRVFDTDQKVMMDLTKWISIEEMEEQGYYEGPRVMLKRKVPDQDDVAQMLIEKADQTFESLKQAWALRPEDDQKTEDRLLKALAKAQRLQRELRALFAKKKSKVSQKKLSS